MTDVGFPDFQEQAQWSSLPFLNNAFAITNAFSLPIVSAPTSNWQGMAILVDADSLKDTLYSISWYYDAALTQIAGQRGFEVRFGGRAQFTIPHLGPYMAIYAATVTGSGTTTIRAAHVNRVGLTMAVNDGSILSAGGPIIVPAATASSVLLSLWYVGRAVLWSDLAAGKSCLIRLRTTFGTGVPTQFAGHDARAQTLFQQTTQVLLPPSPVTVVLENNEAAAQTFFYALVQDDWRT
jgi:hypothetical protein